MIYDLDRIRRIQSSFPDPKRAYKLYLTQAEERNPEYSPCTKLLVLRFWSAHYKLYLFNYSIFEKPDASIHTRHLIPMQRRALAEMLRDMKFRLGNSFDITTLNNRIQQRKGRIYILARIHHSYYQDYPMLSIRKIIKGGSQNWTAQTVKNH